MPDAGRSGRMISRRWMRALEKKPGRSRTRQRPQGGACFAPTGGPGSRTERGKQNRGQNKGKSGHPRPPQEEQTPGPTNPTRQSRGRRGGTRGRRESSKPKHPGGGRRPTHYKARGFKTKAGKGARPQGRAPAVPPTTAPLRRPGYPGGRGVQGPPRTPEGPAQLRRTRDGGPETRPGGPQTTDAPGNSGTRPRPDSRGAGSSDTGCAGGRG